MHDHNLFTDIKKLLIETKLAESHTTEEIKDLSTSELKKLHKEYLAKDTDEAKKEADEIKKEIESRGEDEGEEKADVAQQNEELLAILDTLCEMVGLDMMTLVEETREEMKNLGLAYSWDKPAPEGVMASTDRLARVKANMARLGKRRERGALKTGEETAYKIEMGGEDLVHEPTAKERAKGAPSARVDPKGYDKVQDSIEKIADKFTMDRAKQNAFNAMKPFALQPKPKATKAKGKGKK
jgi:uncharacterized protein YpuA (DUF1002 family)